MKKLLLSLGVLVFIVSQSTAQSPVLFGTTTDNGMGTGGTFFKMNPDGSNYVVLHYFDGWTDGSHPHGNVIEASDGNLYGCAYDGGVHIVGTLWRYNVVTYTHEILHQFNSSSGGLPNGGVVQGPDGKIWGIASYGSPIGGAIYSYDMTTNSYFVEHEFSYTSGGSSPLGAPIFVGNVLYGQTYDDATTHDGVIYSYDISTATYAELHHFNHVDGGNPNGPLFYTSNGKLYGTTSNGGINHEGVVFSYDIPTDTYTKIHDFSWADGNTPLCGFAEGPNGKIYSTTMSGGAHEVGTIFCIQLSDDSYTKVHDFDPPNGTNPRADLLFDASTNQFYGTTYGGGVGFGTIFAFDPVTNTLVKTHDFNITDGVKSEGRLTFAKDLDSLITAPTGIKTESAIETQVFPNPVMDYFTITLQDAVQGDLRFELMDIHGKIVITWIENNVEANFSKKVDVRELPKGTYILQISDGKLKSTQKIVK